MLRLLLVIRILATYTSVTTFLTSLPLPCDRPLHLGLLGPFSLTPLPPSPPCNTRSCMPCRLSSLRISDMLPLRAPSRLGSTHSLHCILDEILPSALLFSMAERDLPSTSNHLLETSDVAGLATSVPVHRMTTAGEKSSHAVPLRRRKLPVAVPPVPAWAHIPGL